MFTEQSFQPLVRDDSKSSVLINRKQRCPRKGDRPGRQREMKGRGKALPASASVPCSWGMGTLGRRGSTAYRLPSRSNSQDLKALPVGLGLPLRPGGLGPGPYHPPSLPHGPPPCSLLWPEGIMRTLLVFQLHVGTWKPSPSLTSPPQARTN